MRVAGKLLFLIGITAALCGCAEVIPLTGGPEDDSAPAVVSQEPPQGTMNYRGNEINVVFDEYVKINDPNATVTINPATVKVKTALSKRTLKLYWDGNLQQNTTYIIQLNGTVRDVNEANDSIMQFVFSTGSVIDSLQIKGNVAGAFSNNAMPQVTLGLYAPDSNFLTTRPIYATRSNAKGEFTFSYLKPGNYRLFAFNDVNKDQRPQADESAGFANETVMAGDTVAAEIRMFKRQAKKSTLRADILVPGAAVVYNIDSLDLSRLTINGVQPKLLEKFSNDSLLVALPEGIATNFNFVYDSTRLSKPVTAAERNLSFRLTQKGQTEWRSGDTLYFTIPDEIKGADTSRLSVATAKGQRVSYAFETRENKLVLIPDPKTTEPFNVRFEKGAVSGQTSVNDTAVFSYKTLLKADLGNLRINCKGFEGSWIFDLTQNDKVVYSQLKPENDTIVDFTRIVPGAYNLRCTLDENRNGRWDGGNIELKIQPEIVRRFTLTQKIRPNWDVEETVTLEK